MKKQFQKLTGSVFKMLILFALLLPGSIQAQSYCKTKGVNSITRKLWIERFELGTISNLSGNNGGYGNFTTQTATAAAGGTIAYNVETDRLLFKNLFFARIFVDFNNDQDFDDLGETVVEDTSYVSLAGTFSIPANASVGNVRVRVAFKRIGYAPNCGAYFLGETEDYTLNITPGLCAANAGTLTANFNSVCAKAGSAVLAATPNGNAIVPNGFQTIYVLTKTSGLIIEQTNSTPLFAVSGGGLYTIHTLVYDSTLDLSIVVPGVTTGFDVNGLLIQGGGSICASLDVAGAQFNVTNPDAGTLTAVNATICGAGGTLSATADGNSNVPAGYNVIYVLTSGTGLVIEQVNATPSFTVTGSGLYTIHTLVYDNTLDLSIVVPGVTTGFDVNGLLVQGGGSVCASLDVAGAQFNVTNPDAGSINPDQFLNCLENGSAVLTGNPVGNSNVPSGYQVVYVLTRGQGLIIQQAGANPQFTVTQTGLYRIHTLVYDPATLNLGIIVPGVTTGFDVNGLLVQGGGSICASLDVQGAPFLVFGSFICNLFGINNSIINLPANESQMTEESIRLAENSMEGGILISNAYPNPAQTEVNIQYLTSENGISTISLQNMMGQTMMVERFEDIAGLSLRTINLSALESGNYLIRLENNGKVQTTKVNVIR